MACMDHAMERAVEDVEYGNEDSHGGSVFKLACFVQDDEENNNNSKWESAVQHPDNITKKKVPHLSTYS